ncbi:MAG: hypothetical protein Q9212_005510 [Teloschistes hypoglaucus]
MALRKHPRGKNLLVADSPWDPSCVIAAAIRIYYLVGDRKVWETPGLNLYDGLVKDNTSKEIIWSQIELSCSILAACLPTYAPLLTHKGRLDRWMGHLVSANGTMGRLVSSLTSLNSHGRRSRENRIGDTIGGRGGTARDDEYLVNGRRDSRWQKTYIQDSRVGETYHVVTIAGGTSKEDKDLEAQEGTSAPLKITVKTDFAIE